MLAFSIAVMAGAPRVSPYNDFRSCEEGASRCDTAGWVVGHGSWHRYYWRYRTEFVNRTAAMASPREIETYYREYCEGETPKATTCLVVWLDTRHPGWAKRACEAGDVGSCLLEALDLPATEAHARMADLCRQGAANACAWHAEVSRLTRAELAGPFAMTQRACLELQEPVACAAAGKIAADHGMDAQSDQWHQTACTWGYEPSCDAEKRDVLALADEAPPAVVGPSMLQPGSLEPLPGRPALPR